MSTTFCDAAYEALLDAMPVGRAAACAQPRRFLVSVQRPDGSADNYERTGGSSCDHAQEAQDQAGLGAVVRVLPIDQAAA